MSNPKIIELPIIDISTNIAELPDFSSDARDVLGNHNAFSKTSSEHPTRKFFNAIIPHIRQVYRLCEHYETDSIDYIAHGKNQDCIFFHFQGVHSESCMWVTLRIKNESPFIEFVDTHINPYISFDISLARKTPIYNYEMLFYRWFPIEDIPMTHVADHVRNYCQNVLHEVCARLQIGPVDVSKARISINHHTQTMVLTVENIPHLIYIMNTTAHNGMIISIDDPVNQECSNFAMEPPEVVKTTYA